MHSRAVQLNPDKNLQAYVIGVAIGDGNLSNPNGRATRLRISCDKKYPNLIKRIATSLQELFPENKIGFINRQGCVDISVYSNHLEKLLGWRALGGSKAYQKVHVPNWILNGKNGYKINCLRGLIETDGAIYDDRKYRMVIFSSVIPELAENVLQMMKSLGFQACFYKTNQKVENFIRTKYQVRLSKNVGNFLNLIHPAKS